MKSNVITISFKSLDIHLQILYLTLHRFPERELEL